MNKLQIFNLSTLWNKEQSFWAEKRFRCSELHRVMSLKYARDWCLMDLCVCPWVCHSFSPSHPHPFFMYLIQAHFPHSSLLSIFLIFFSCLLTLLSNLFFLSQWETHSSFSTHSPPYIFYLNSLSVSLYRSLSNTKWFHMNHLSGCDILMTVNHVDVTLLTSVIITPWVWLNSVFS